MSYFTINSEVKSVKGMDDLSCRKTLIDGNGKLQLVEYHDKKDSISERHMHKKEDMVCYLISGKIRETIGNQTRELTSGDSWFVPAGVEHESYTIEDSILVCIFSPPCKDRS